MNQGTHNKVEMLQLGSMSFNPKFLFPGNKVIQIFQLVIIELNIVRFPGVKDEPNERR